MLPQPRFHVVYWEGGTPGGVCLESHDRLQPERTSAASRPPAPVICRSCGEVTHSYRNRLDNLHACIRSCGKEGNIFRGELVDFVCLSPCSVIRYALPAFSDYLTKCNMKALTENVVLGTAIKVQQGVLSAEECGVDTLTLGGVPELQGWLRHHLGGVRRAAEAAGGRAAAVLYDPSGEELLNLDPGAPEPGSNGWRGGHKPITDVLVLLGGPSGIAPSDLEVIDAELALALHHVLRVKLPGGLHHSNVVLADLFMSQARGALLPSLELLALQGAEGYRRWRFQAQTLLRSLFGSAFTEASPAAGSLEGGTSAASGARDRAVQISRVMPGGGWVSRAADTVVQRPLVAAGAWDLLSAKLGGAEETQERRGRDTRPRPLPANLAPQPLIRMEVRGEAVQQGLTPADARGGRRLPSPARWSAPSCPEVAALPAVLAATPLGAGASCTEAELGEAAADTENDLGALAGAFPNGEPGAGAQGPLEAASSVAEDLRPDAAPAMPPSAAAGAQEGSKDRPQQPQGWGRSSPGQPGQAGEGLKCAAPALQDDDALPPQSILEASWPDLGAAAGKRGKKPKR